MRSVSASSVSSSRGFAIDAPRRGRPAEMSDEAVLNRIRALARRDAGLFRVHRTHPGLYARARRQFGSWSAAVERAGLDYRMALDRARSRSIRVRRGRRRRDRRPSD
jgi:hypothetical protein